MCPLMSTAVSATAVLIQLVSGEQKLQTADFRCTPRKHASCRHPIPSHWHLTSWAEGWSIKVGIKATLGDGTPPPENQKLDLIKVPLTPQKI